MSVRINGRTTLGLFENPTHKMIRDYIYNNWHITNPDRSENPPYDYSTNIRFVDFDYDYFATYHVMINQDDSTKFDNDLLGQGLLKLIDPIIIEISARRLTYGKTFDELDNIRMEIIRILGQFNPDNLPIPNDFMKGIHAIEVFEPGDILPISQFINKLPRNIWRAQVKCMVHYFISYS
jgi:hypothetical protein